jgi:hypothetical protein
MVLTIEANIGAVLEGAMCANTVFQDANLAGLYLLLIAVK